MLPLSPKVAAKLQSGAIDLTAASLLLALLIIPWRMQQQSIPWQPPARPSQGTGQFVPRVKPNPYALAWAADKVIPNSFYHLLTQLQPPVTPEAEAPLLEENLTCSYDGVLEEQWTQGDPARREALRKALYRLACQKKQ
ncbi:MAG: hypothetical protein FJX76_10440 [Armatimonadetes bacterium]|nr:hypothetical protein [Armatimonadota bacterium]